MDLTNVIKKIIFLPIEFGKPNNHQSIHSLLKETGYFDVHDKVTESTILQELINHLNCVERWLAWSENKRSANGWYFLKKDEDRYVVGNIDSHGKKSEYFEFDDVVKTCSIFIKREIETIRVN